MTGVTAQDVIALCRFLDMTINDKDLNEVALRLESMQGFVQELAALDLGEELPDVPFDPNWPTR